MITIFTRRQFPGRSAFFTLGAAALLFHPHLVAADTPPAVGQRVFITAHSFHNFVAQRLQPVVLAAGIKGHELAGRQMLGGSRVIQHWNLPDEKNLAKTALREGKVDVLTMSPNWTVPDEGIERFLELGIEHNPKVRVLVLRELVAAGKVPGITKQSELFTDQIGHAKPPVTALATYCIFACIYRTSPIGLDDPQPELDRISPDLKPLLQRIAWETVTAHPMSGVTNSAKRDAKPVQ